MAHLDQVGREKGKASEGRCPKRRVIYYQGYSKGKKGV